MNAAQLPRLFGHHFSVPAHLQAVVCDEAEFKAGIGVGKGCSVLAAGIISWMDYIMLKGPLEI